MEVKAVALFSLAHEGEIRKSLGYPGLTDLWAPGSRCLFDADKGGSLSLLRRNPEQGFRRAGVAHAERLQVYDDLMAHARFVAAADVAGYLAATPDFIRHQGTRRARTLRFSVDVDLRALAFTRAKEAAACIEAGQHPRARMLLTQVRKLSRRLPANDITSQLIRANEPLLWGRLLQLMWLPQRSDAYLSLAEKRLLRTGLQLPAGFELLRIRSAADLGPADATRRIEKAWSSECRPSASNLFGGLCEHYGHYLLARCSLATRSWEQAARHLDVAESLLESHKHVSRDPIRLAFTVLGRGRARIGLGASNTNGSAFQDGLNLLLSARSGFRELDFVLGEYLAHWHYMQAVRLQDSPAAGGSLEVTRDAYRLAQQTRVARFQLEAGLAYAGTLNDEGRKNAAYAIVEGLRKSPDPIAEELNDGCLADDFRILDEKTRNAADNAIEPTAHWGSSAYAMAESEFVGRVATAPTPTLVSVSGPPGSGRRILLSRIASARGQRPDPEVLAASELSAIDLLLNNALSAKTPLILHDLDQWPSELQRRALRRLAQTPETMRLCYIALTKPWPETSVGSHLSRSVGEALANGAWRIQRSDDEWRKDAPLLARGFLAAELRRQGELLANVKNLILSGAACRWIRDNYGDVSNLFRAMRFLAPRIRLGRDTVALPDGRHRLAVEAIVKHLRPQQLAPVSRADRPHALAPDGSPRIGREVLDADEATVIELAEKTEGVFARIGLWSDVPRATIIYNWNQNGRMQWWRAAVASRTGATEPSE